MASVILDGERRRVTIFKRPSADATSVEKTVPQKSASNAQMSVIHRKRRDECVPEGAVLGSMQEGSVTSEWGRGGYTQAFVCYISTGQRKREE